MCRTLAMPPGKIFDDLSVQGPSLRSFKSTTGSIFSLVLFPQLSDWLYLIGDTFIRQDIESYKHITKVYFTTLSLLIVD